jgi:hypothetical protein
MAVGIRAALVALFACSCMTAAHASAVEPQPVVRYLPGWQMAGAPPGTDFSQAEALFTYARSGYRTPPTSRATLCQGYWFYAGAPDHWLVPLNGRAPQTAVSCPLRAGWNLIGNPYLAAALLPSDVTAFTLGPSGYSVVRAIPLGSAVWIYSQTASRLQLTPTSVGAPAVTIAVPSTSGTATYTLRVGQSLRLIENAATNNLVIGVDPHFLALEESGTVGGTTIWQYRATAAGTTNVLVNLSCFYLHPACLPPTEAIPVHITP